MELILHIANATFSSLELQTKQSKCLKNTAFKQKTFRIVKEHAIRKVSRDHASSWRTEAGMGSSHRADREAGKAVGSKQELHGGASRDRTGDLLVANQTLSQLSYGP
jgi:hypothetical protein